MPKQDTIGSSSLPPSYPRFRSVLSCPVTHAQSISTASKAGKGAPPFSLSSQSRWQMMAIACLRWTRIWKLPPLTFCWPRLHPLRQPHSSDTVPHSTISVPCQRILHAKGQASLTSSHVVQRERHTISTLQPSFSVPLSTYSSQRRSPERSTRTQRNRSMI